MRALSRFWGTQREVLKRGGLITPSEFGGMPRFILNHCRAVVTTVLEELEHHYQWQLDKLDFFFLRSADVNAVMIRHNDRHGIGFCVGLPFTLKIRLDNALGSPEFLSDYLSPKERPQWSWQYLGQMIEHAYLHEAAHALRGHLPYLNSLRHHRRTKRPRRLVSLDERTHRDDHYVELDADLQALDMWMEITTGASDYPSTQHFREELYFQKLLTLQLLYQSLDTSNVPIRQALRTGHPPAIHRTLALANAMRHSAADGLGMNRALIENVHHEAIWEASMAAKANGLVFGRWWGTHIHRQGRKAYDRLVAHYLKHAEPAIDAFGAELPDELV